MLSVDIAVSLGELSLQVKLSPADGTTIVIGPNGAGKSTLLKCILGAVQPKAGEIRLGDETLFSSRDRIDVPMEERKLGYVPQRYALFPHMTVTQNVEFGIRDVPSAQRQSRVESLLDDLEISHLADRKTPSLSGGESQRVALARAMAIGPRALLLDEPMAALDAGARRMVRRFLAVRLRAIGIPTLVVSHDADDLESLGGRIAALESGKIVQVGTLEELRENPETDFIREFLCPEPAEPVGDVNAL